MEEFIIMEENLKEETLTNEQIAERMADELAKERLKNADVQVLDSVTNINAPLATIIIFQATIRLATTLSKIRLNMH